MAVRPSRRQRGELPNLIVIGAAHCATTSLHHYLSRHPQIAMSRTKELDFFADEGDFQAGPPFRTEVDRRATERRRGNWSRGLGWYRSQFDPSATVRGESSPIYTDPWFPRCAERMADVIPEARLIFCVRDPVERAISHYHHSHAGGHDPRPAEEALSLPGSRYLLSSRYAECLEPYLARFPRERIHLLAQEDLGASRRETLADVFRFLEVDESFWSPWFDRRWNESAHKGGARWRAISRLRRSRTWRRIAALPPQESGWLLERLSRRGRPNGAAQAAPSAEVLAFLRDSLRDEAARLQELTGRSFASLRV